MGLPRDSRPSDSLRRQEPDELWARVGGGLEEVSSGRRHGPADRDFPPPGGPWEALWSNGRLVGWAPANGLTKFSSRRAQEEGERISRERRAHLLTRLGHKLRSSVLALQQSARQAAFGRKELVDLYELAGDVGRRAQAMEVVAVDANDPPRAVVIGAVLNLAAAGARRVLPGDAMVRASEPVLVDALTRVCEWMGGPGCTVTGERCGNWWRLEVTGPAVRQPLPMAEMGEPLVRHLVDTLLDGWLDSSAADRAVIYLQAG